MISKRRKVLLMASLALTTMLAGCSSSEPKAQPTPSPPVQSRAGATVLYSTAWLNDVAKRDIGVLWRYDAATDHVARVTSTEGVVHGWSPAFHGENITYLAGDLKRLVELDPKTGAVHTLVRGKETILAYSWSRDGRRLAYIGVDYEKDEEHHLRVVDMTTRRSTKIKDLGRPVGREGGDADTVSIAWDRAGKRLLVNDTYADAGPTLTVRLLSVSDGSDLIHPIKDGANAFWSIDESAIYWRSQSRRDRAWYHLDLKGQRRQRIALSADAMQARLSPNGSMIVANIGFGTNIKVVLFDVAGNTQRPLRSHYRDAIWLADDTLAMTRVVPCPPNDDDCAQYGWHGASVITITLPSTARSVHLGSTMYSSGSFDIAIRLS